MRVSYLILTWNRKDALKRHLDLLMEQTYQEPFEVIVCVDGSTDGTQEMLVRREANSKYSLRWFDTGNIDKNTAAQARNIGIRNATGDILVMLDDDCLPHKALIETYLKSFNSQEVQLGYKSSQEAWLEMDIPVPIEPGLMLTWWFDAKIGQFGHFQTGNICLSMKAARTQAKDGSIGFDERFVGYGHEDTEFGRRLYGIGYRLVFNPDALAYHMHPGVVTQQDSETKRREAIESSQLLSLILEEK